MDEENERRVTVDEMRQRVTEIRVTERSLRERQHVNRSRCTHCLRPSFLRPCRLAQRSVSEEHRRRNALMPCWPPPAAMCRSVEISVRATRLAATRTGQELDRTADDHAGASAGYQVRSVLWGRF